MPALVILLMITLSLLTLCLFAFFFEFADTRVNFEFDPFGIVEVGVTIWLGIFLANKIQKQAHENRVEKDLIIEDVKEFDSGTNDVSIYFTDISSSIDFNKIKAKLHENHVVINKVYDKLSISGFIELLGRDWQRFRESETNLRKEITGDTSLLNNGFLEFDTEKIMVIKGHLKVLDQLSYKLIVAINRL